MFKEFNDKSIVLDVGLEEEFRKLMIPNTNAFPSR